MTIPDLLSTLKGLRAKATEGPWEHPEMDARIYGANGFVLAHTMGQSLRPVEEHEANANLIVALEAALPQFEAFIEGVKELAARWLKDTCGSSECDHEHCVACRVHAKRLDELLNPPSPPVKMSVRYCGHEAPVGEKCPICYPPSPPKVSGATSAAKDGDAT